MASQSKESQKYLITEYYWGIITQESLQKLYKLLPRQIG